MSEEKNEVFLDVKGRYRGKMTVSLHKQHYLRISIKLYKPFAKKHKTLKNVC